MRTTCKLGLPVIFHIVLLIFYSFFDEYFFNILWCSGMVMCCSFPVLGSVYMRKLALVRVSYRDSLFDFVLHFICRYLKLALHVDKIRVCHSKLQTLRMHFPFQFTGRPISLQNGWPFCIYMIHCEILYWSEILAPVQQRQ